MFYFAYPQPTSVRTFIRQYKYKYSKIQSQNIFSAGNPNTPSNPEPRPEPQWMARHEGFKANTANNPDIPIIFYGDR